MTHEVGIDVAWLDGTLVVHGEIDIDTCHVLREAIAQHTVAGRIVIDMAGCAFCDSSCLRCLADPVRDGITVVIRRPSPAVRKAMTITGIDQMVTVED